MTNLHSLDFFKLASLLDARFAIASGGVNKDHALTK